MDELIELLKNWHNEFEKNDNTDSKTIEYNLVSYMYDVLLPEVANLFTTNYFVCVFQNVDTNN